jgi:F0F1-type ATP synthase membrane subunit b/b'
MVLVTGNWRTWLIGMAASLIIFAVVYFTAIKPSTDTANQAIKTGLQQSQQAINQGQQALSQAGKQLGSASGKAGTVAGQAQQQLSKAQKLTNCIAAAGTDVTKVQACQLKFG